MDLLVILISLGVERVLGLGSELRSFSFVAYYTTCLRRLFAARPFWSGPWGLVAIVMPMLLALFLVCWLIHDALFGLLAFIMNAVVLWFCLGPQDLERDFLAYSAVVDDTSQSADKSVELLDAEPVTDPAQQGRAVTRAILWQAHERTFGVIFWYVLGGVMGAAAYRLLWWLDAVWDKEADEAALASVISQVHGLLAWLPARLCGLSYALAGNFTPAFAAWYEHALQRGNSREVLVSCGEQALGLNNEENGGGIEENQAALDLTGRGLIVWLAVIAVLTLGKILY